jgi:hypothetical protein
MQMWATVSNCGHVSATGGKGMTNWSNKWKDQILEYFGKNYWPQWWLWWKNCQLLIRTTRIWTFLVCLGTCELGLLGMFGHRGQQRATKGNCGQLWATVRNCELVWATVGKSMTHWSKSEKIKFSNILWRIIDHNVDYEERFLNCWSEQQEYQLLGMIGHLLATVVNSGHLRATLGNSGQLWETVGICWLLWENAWTIDQKSEKMKFFNIMGRIIHHDDD